MDEIFKQYHFFQVKTIDKFMNSVLLGCSFKMGITSFFKIESQITEYLQISFDELLQQSINNKEIQKVLDDFFK